MAYKVYIHNLGFIKERNTRKVKIFSSRSKALARLNLEKRRGTTQKMRIEKAN